MASYLNHGKTPTPNIQNNVNPTQQLANMINQFKGVQNPQALIAQLSQKNPQAAQQFQALMQSGGNPQEIAQSMMKQRGIDINQLMSMIK